MYLNHVLSNTASKTISLQFPVDVNTWSAPQVDWLSDLSRHQTDLQHEHTIHTIVLLESLGHDYFRVPDGQMDPWQIPFLIIIDITRYQQIHVKQPAGNTHTHTSFIFIYYLHKSWLITSRRKSQLFLARSNVFHVTSLSLMILMGKIPKSQWTTWVRVFSTAHASSWPKHGVVGLRSQQPPCFGEAQLRCWNSRDFRWISW